MNRAPVALFALLCTLASSMVAAGVASDRPANVGNHVMRDTQKSELKKISFSGSAHDKWLTKPNWQAIDVERAVALPSKKIPTRIPEKVKPVAAIIITIEQAPAPVAKVATKPVAAPKPAAQKATAANHAVKTEQAVKAVMSVVSKMAVAAKTAPIQPRVSASFSSTTYVPTKEVRGVLATNRVAVSDLHLCQPGIATMSGSLTALPIAEIAKKTADSTLVTVGGGKLQIAYGSLNMINVGGTSFTPSPYIADNAASILLNKGVSTTVPKQTAKTRNRSADFSVWSWTGDELNRLQLGLRGTFDRLALHLSRQVNEAAVIYLSRIRSFNSAQWVPVLGGERATIKSAQLKSSVKASATK